MINVVIRIQFKLKKIRDVVLELYGLSVRYAHQDNTNLVV